MDWIALIAPPLLWIRYLWDSAPIKTYRHRLSGSLSILAGILMFVAIRLDWLGFRIVFGAGCVVMVAMVLTGLWPPRLEQPKRKNKWKR